MRRDIDLLERILGQVILEQDDKSLFGAEEEIRFLGSRTITTSTSGSGLA